MSISLPTIPAGNTNWAGTVNGYWATIQKLLNSLVAQNQLINGGFDIAQRGSTISGVAQDKYGADRWRTCRESTAAGSTVDFSQQNISAFGSTNVNSLYGGRWTKRGATASKLAIFQPIEGINTIPFRGRTLTFQCRIRIDSGTRNFRIAVVQSTNAIDTGLPGTFVNSWSSTDLTFNGTSPMTIVGSSVQCQASGTYQSFYVNATIPTGTSVNNLVVAIWSESQFTTDGQWFEVAEAGLYDSDQVRDWLPRPIQQELAMCQRYCELYTLPGSACVASSYNAGAGGGISVPYSWHVQKRTSSPQMTNQASLTGSAGIAIGSVTGYTDLFTINVTGINAVNYWFGTGGYVIGDSEL